MGEDGYDIGVYTAAMMPQIIGLMAHLWAERPGAREGYFRWKYVDNPYTEEPLGIVAMYQGRVVGFRGYFALRYELPDRARDLIVLCAGDTCVHPDHRSKGLSVRMGNLAMDAFAGKYEIFLNMTATFASLPGYLKMGFHPLAKKVYLSQYSLAGFARYLTAYNRRRDLDEGKINFESSERIRVSDRPEPEGMSAVCAKQESTEHHIRLSKDLSFFRWRFGNVNRKYVFYCHYLDDEIIGYVVIGLSPNHRRGYVLDFADTNGRSVADILRFISQHRPFDILSIYDFCLTDAFRKDLKDLGFKTTGLVRRIEQKKMGELPLLIRPVKRNDTENDWMVEDLDVRKIENWKISEICSDAV